MLEGKNVLVTGAGGFIGSHLAERLVRDGAHVTAFLRYKSRTDEGNLQFLPQEVREQIDVVYGDVTELESVLGAVQGMDIIFHLAALTSVPYSLVHPQEVVSTNIVGTCNILKAALDEQVERVVLTSTSEVYGTAQYVPINERHPLQAQSVYSGSKIGADALGVGFYRSFGLPVSIIRPFNTYGPRQTTRAVIPTIITQALAGEEITLGSLTPTRDFNYVTDTVDGFVRLAESDVLGEPINLGTGIETSIGELVRLVGSLVGRELCVRQDKVRKRPKSSEVNRLCADASNARELLGWKPGVSLEEGLRRTIDWISEHLVSFKPGEYRI